MTDRQAADAEIIGLAGEITYASEIGVDEDLDEALAALRVALAAPAPPGLDVERLARAMTNVGIVRGDSHFDADLASVAAEYARLEGEK